MKLQILAVRDCPNVAVLRQRLADLVAGRVDVTIGTEVVETLDQAVLVGMSGSPTLLVNGADPFAEPGQAPSLSCRLYRDETGNPTGAPSPTQLRAALGTPDTPPGGSAAEAAPAVRDCCAPVENEPVENESAGSSVEGLRTWRARTIPTDPAAHAVHQAILGAFATTGQPPTEAALRQITAVHGAAVDLVLARLHDADVIRLDPAGAIVVAYPFSTVPTRHRVRLASGVEVSAMCAIDALGIPVMLATDATITSAGPVTGQPVTVTVLDGRYTWNPATAVFYSAAAGTGPSADCCCHDLNAFTDTATAQTWTRAHPSIPGELLDTLAAERLGQHVFGGLLDHPGTSG